MFAQSTFIEDTHKPIMESVIRQNNYVNEKLMTRLYAAAWALYTDRNWKAQSSDNLSLSRIESKEAVVAAATDMLSGFYVQLAGDVKPQTVGKQLTVGRKLLMQGKHESLGQMATKLW
jgi:hypothetical protein